MAERALKSLLGDGAILAPIASRPGRFGVYPAGDRRRRPRGSVSASELAALLSQGAIIALGADAYGLSSAGRARAIRAQNGGPLLLEERTVVDEDGALRPAVGVEPAVARLARLKDMSGEPWLSSEELLAARRLSADLEAGSRGDFRLSRWGAQASVGQVGVRGAAGAEAALALGMEARARAHKALEALAPPLRQVAQRICLEGLSLEDLERRGRWPARAGKVALKLALSQLAQAYLRL